MASGDYVTGGKCPVKSDEVARRLCNLHFPYCRSCRSHYKRWIESEPEVQKLEAAAHYPKQARERERNR